MAQRMVVVVVNGVWLEAQHQAKKREKEGSFALPVDVAEQYTGAPYDCLMADKSAVLLSMSNFNTAKYSRIYTDKAEHDRPLTSIHNHNSI